VDLRGQPVADVRLRAVADDAALGVELVRPQLLTLGAHTGGRDGYISIEEEAEFAFEVESAVARAHELRELVDRPNLMVKVPGTDAGVEAFRHLTREGLTST
jgi:transaldolase